MTNAEVTVRPLVHSGGALVLRGDQRDWTDQQRAALAQIGIADAPIGDQLVFLHVCQRMGLDPFNKEIYMIGRWDSELGRKKWTIQVGIDGFRSKSEEHPDYEGVGDAEWCGEDGVWREVWAGPGAPMAARFSVYRRGLREPVRAVAHYREYVQTNSQGQPTRTWRLSPANQLSKCAEALARRRAFPRRLGGLYVHEEMQHLDNPVPPPVIATASPDPEPDWDTMITQHEQEGDRDKLADLWRLARGMCPNDTALLERIAAAGERLTASSGQSRAVEDESGAAP